MTEGIRRTHNNPLMIIAITTFVVLFPALSIKYYGVFGLIFVVEIIVASELGKRVSLGLTYIKALSYGNLVTWIIPFIGLFTTVFMLGYFWYQPNEVTTFQKKAYVGLSIIGLIATLIYGALPLL